MFARHRLITLKTLYSFHLLDVRYLHSLNYNLSIISFSFWWCVDLEESDTSSDLLRATDDDVVDVVVALTWNIKDALVPIRRGTTSLLRQESDWTDLVEESELWLDLAWEAH